MDIPSVRTNIKKIARSLKPFFMYVFYLMIEFITCATLHEGYKVYSMDDKRELPVAIALHALLSVVCCYSVFRLFSVHDSEAKKRFAEAECDGNYFKILAYTAKSKEFLYMLAFTVPMSLLFGIGRAYRMYFFNDLHFVLKTAVGVLIISTVLLLAQTSAKVYIFDIKGTGEQYKEIGRTRVLVWQLIKMFFIYLIGSLFMYPAMRFVISTVKILRILPIGAFLCILSVFLLPVVISILRAFVTRHKFIKELKLVCSGHGFELSKIRRPYLTLLFKSREADFTVRTNDKIYTCKLLPCIYKPSTLYLKNDGRYIQRYPIRLRNVEIYAFHVLKKYGFEGKGERLIIACPAPYEIYMTEYGDAKLTESGYNVWDYKLYTSSGLINLLDFCTDKN